MNYIFEFFLGGKLKYQTMVVAMHQSEVGEMERESDTIQFPEDSRHLLSLTNMFYYNNSAIKCSVNKKAIRDITEFLDWQVIFLRIKYSFGKYKLFI